MALFFIFYHMIIYICDGQQKILEKHILGGNSPGFPSDFPANLDIWRVGVRNHVENYRRVQ